MRQTNYVKSIVTAQGKMDLERKGKQSYQGWMCARLLAFCNGDLQALFDRSDGFYRRQLVLTTKEKPAGRVDDPDLAEKMKAEVEGISAVGLCRDCSGWHGEQLQVYRERAHQREPGGSQAGQQQCV